MYQFSFSSLSFFFFFFLFFSAFIIEQECIQPKIVLQVPLEPHESLSFHSLLQLPGELLNLEREKEEERKKEEGKET